MTLKREKKHCETEKEVYVHFQAPVLAEEGHELLAEEVMGVETQMEMSTQDLNDLEEKMKGLEEESKST